MANPTKQEILDHYTSIINGLLDGYSSNEEIGDVDLETVNEGVYNGINTVCPNKGVASIKYGATGGGL
nr:hypothetical protein [uncultured Flavobacterium sp.]